MRDLNLAIGLAAGGVPPARREPARIGPAWIGPERPAPDLARLRAAAAPRPGGIGPRPC